VTKEEREQRIWAKVEARRIVDRLYSTNPDRLMNTLDLFKDIREAILRARTL
jgi:hypothetical protein